MQPYLVDEALHSSQFSIIRGFGSIEVDLVSGPEVAFEQLAVLCHFLKAEERFASGDTRAERTHILGFLDDLFRDIDRMFVGKDSIGPFPLARKGAVPAGTIAASRNKEHHLRTLVTEDTAFGERHFFLVEIRHGSDMFLYFLRAEMKTLLNGPGLPGFKQKPASFFPILSYSKEGNSPRVL
jgi:hypothetical protein